MHPHRHLPWLAIVTCLAACGAHVPVSTSIPDPLVEAMPLTVAVVYDEDFSKYSYSEESAGADWTINLGDSNTRMLDKVLNKSFARVVRREEMPKEGEDLTGIDFLLKPEVDEYAFLTPADSGVDFYSVSIRYNLAAYAPNGLKIDDWQINSYGRTKASKLQPKDSLAAATDVALRDAAAALALDFRDRPRIRALLQEDMTGDQSTTQHSQ
jgi:hypothetical protein